MALPTIGDGEQVGDGNTNEVMNVGRTGQSLQVGGSAATPVGFYGTAPASQRTATIQAASLVSAASYISVSTNLSVWVTEVTNTLTGLGLWKGS